MHSLALDLQQIKGTLLNIQEQVGLLGKSIIIQDQRLTALETENIRRQAIHGQQELARLETIARSKWALAMGLAVGGIVVGAIEAAVRILA